MRIPFVPFPLKTALGFSRVFLGFGNSLANSLPSLKLNLFQAQMDVQPRDYCSVVIFSTFFYFILTNLVILALEMIAGVIEYLFPLGVSAIASIFVFSYLVTYPKLIATRRMRMLERDLLGALNHMYIELKSGVTLFNSMVGLTDGYGEVSEEFKKIVKDINAGISEMTALDNASRRNPSLSFRRALWQIINSLRSGSNIAKSLETIVDVMVKDQIIAIRRYGQELNPYTMMYMLAAVIMPSMGITFLIILSSFAGIVIPNLIFPLILLFLIFFQIFYLGIIKVKRPVMEI